MSFNPNDIAGIQGWWDAADPTTISGTAPVLQWNDKSENGFHLAELSLGPDYLTNEKVLRFQGAANSSTIGQTLDLPPMSVRTVACFVDALRPVTNNNRYHALLGHSTNRDSLYIDLPASTPAAFGVRPKNGLNSVACNGGDWVRQSVVNETVVMPLSLTGDIILVEYAVPVTSFTWLAASGASRNYRPDYDLGELMIFDRALSVKEKEEIEGYLAHKWNRAGRLPASHHFKEHPPGYAQSLLTDNCQHSHRAGAATVVLQGALELASSLIRHACTMPAIALMHSIRLDEVAGNRIFQRQGNRADIPLTGRFAGAEPAVIEARVLKDDLPVTGWAALEHTVIGEGLWSGLLKDVPEGGLYHVALRTRDVMGEVLGETAGTTAWGVGDLYGLIGSSSAERWFTTGSGYTPHPWLMVYDGSWRAQNETGAAAVTFGNQMIATSGVPVALLDYGVGGSRLSQWKLPSSAQFSAFSDALEEAGRVRAVVMVVGLNDARGGAIASQATHETGLRTLISNIRLAAQDLTLPIFIWGAQRCLQPDMNDRQFNDLRNAEQAVGKDTGVVLGTTTVDLPLLSDKLHLTEAGMAMAAQRMARAVGSILDATGAAWRGPRIYSARRVDMTKTDVIIAHDGGSSVQPVSGMTGFQLSDDAFETQLDVEEARLQPSGAIRLIHRPSEGSGELQLRYQYGAGPNIAAAVYDDAVFALPLAPMGSALSVSDAYQLLPDNSRHDGRCVAPDLSIVRPVNTLNVMRSRHSLTASEAQLFPVRAAALARQIIWVERDVRRLRIDAE